MPTIFRVLETGSTGHPMLCTCADHIMFPVQIEWQYVFVSVVLQTLPVNTQTLCIDSVSVFNSK